MRILSLLLAALLWCGQASAQLGNGGGAGPSGTAGTNGAAGSTGATGAAGVGTFLGSLKSANFNSTADQAIAISYAAYKVSEIDVTNCSGTFTLAAGGFYTGTSKSGTTVVLAAQAWSGATASTVIVQATIVTAVLTVRLTAANIYLSLTTGAGSAATCDVYIYGNPFP
jgi:hypothetical protein